ncbi:MAG: MaoC family dehydratase N-terminal domain-containing protein [Rhodocyclales bacterium]|nr:MaoC family dehydratase N-terminal domain-containing protein [Rhodocyclales bacterium]
MGNIDLEHLRTWIGKSRCDEDLISARHARLMAAAVDYPAAERICDGEVLPPLWHWIYFLEGLPSHELGRDGHPARGGFLPPVPLANRMWAGGRMSFTAPVRIGSIVRKESSILNVAHKTGRSGDLVFVTVLHELKSPQGDLLICEEHDIVYKNASASAKSAAAPPLATPSEFSRTWTPTTTTLFRYSALTFNGHRIHYDADYCREVEGYPNLVIHGPLNATLLASHAEEVSGRRLRDFRYRGMSPALLGDSITLHANVLGDRVVLYATHKDAVCMEAEAMLG